ncbi:GTPase IMAP family member 8-like [Hypomesus transpacificus]|uniref:GTPase IMAP family member 8-like n=1 Tax=Hypomesus transpacificus TaxID=137520 RepID=UPI001F080429|nr:GTPase IMAP family member 8-like [Hypomesus transpacificus]
MFAVEGSPPELRLLLLGRDWLQKSLTGNILLDRKLFDPRRPVDMCVRRQCVHADGRKVTVVSTPQRWLQYAVDDWSLVDRNVADSLSLCQPGPHAFLMVVPLKSCRGREWTLEAPLELLNQALWRSMMVVLTGHEKLTGVSVEEYIARHQYLSEMVERCGHRYQVLDTTGNDVSHVKELFEKIDRMVAGDVEEGGEGYFTMKESSHRAAEVRKRMEEERAEQRRVMVQRRRDTLRSLLQGLPHHLQELNIVMVGARRAGKSSTGNSILGDKVFEAGRSTLKCVSRQGDVAGQLVSVVDTPGWHARYFSEDTPQEIRLEITQSAFLCDNAPQAFLVVVRCDETFTETDRSRLEEHLKLFGPLIWSRTVVLFTWGDRLSGTSIEQHIERWPGLCWLVDRSGNRYQVLENTGLAEGSQVRELLQIIKDTMVENEGGHLVNTLWEFQESNRKLVQRSEEISRRLDEVEKENIQLKLMLKEKERIVADVNERCAEKDYMVTDLRQINKLRVQENEERKFDYEQEIEALTQSCEEKDVVLEKIEREHGVEIRKLQEQVEQLKKRREEAEQDWGTTAELQERYLESESRCVGMEKEVSELSRQLEHYWLQSRGMELLLTHTKEDLSRLGRKTPAGQTDITNLKMEWKVSSEQTGSAPRAQLDEEEWRDAAGPGVQRDRDEWRSTVSWLRVGAVALGAVIGAVAGSVHAPLRVATGGIVGAAVGTLLGASLAQNKFGENRTVTFLTNRPPP